MVASTSENSFSGSTERRQRKPKDNRSGQGAESVTAAEPLELANAGGVGTPRRRCQAVTHQVRCQAIEMAQPSGDLTHTAPTAEPGTGGGWAAGVGGRGRPDRADQTEQGPLLRSNWPEGRDKALHPARGQGNGEVGGM